MNGKYENGQGKASRNMGVMELYFKCPMIGTFNIRADRSIETFRPCTEDSLRKFWLVKLNGQHYAWAYRWNKSNQPGNLLELVSRTPLPDALKTGEIGIEVLERWDKKTIDKWAADQYWFQSFRWGPKRADSDLIWHTVEKHVRWTGKTVLDIGCHYGAHAFAAARAGAQVIGYDKDSRPIETARTINDNIEMQDVTFTTSDPGGMFDVIFYFSVHHQPDPGYHHLAEKLNELRGRANEAVFVELITPDLEGRLSPKRIDALVGGEMLHTYRHAVRGNRRIYRLQGEARNPLWGTLPKLNDYMRDDDPTAVDPAKIVGPVGFSFGFPVLIHGTKAAKAQKADPVRRVVQELARLETAQTMRPTVDIVIPTWQRPEKLARCLESIKAQTYPAIRIHAIEDTERLFAFGIWNRFLASWETGDYFVYLCDDTELAPTCIAAAVDVFARRWPDSDGVVGFHQQIAGKSGWCQSAMGMVGRAFAERFPARQLFCPDYGRFHADAELGDAARKLGRFEHCAAANIIHYHPAHCPGEHDATHDAVRESGPCQRDTVTQRARRKAGFVWGLNFDLVNGKE